MAATFAIRNARAATLDFDEAEHPRAENGEFTAHDHAKGLYQAVQARAKDTTKREKAFKKAFPAEHKAFLGKLLNNDPILAETYGGDAPAKAPEAAPAAEPKAKEQPAPTPVADLKAYVRHDEQGEGTLGQKIAKLQTAHLGNRDLDDETRGHFRTYSGGEYVDVNEGLRKGKLSPKYKAVAEAVQKAIKSTKTVQPFVAYRGVNKHFFKDGAPKAGSVVTEKAFASTSLSKEVAKRFADGEKGYLMHLHVGVGKHALPLVGRNGLTDITGEYETLLPHGTKYKILKVDHEARHIHAEVL